MEMMLSNAYRQMRMLVNANNFTDDKFGLDWYQKLYSGIIWLLGSILSIASSLVKTFFVGTSNTPLEKVAGTIGTNLLDAMSTYMYAVKDRYLRGSQPNDINVAISQLWNALLMAYMTYELFLLTWGLEDKIEGRDAASVKKKLEKASLELDKETKKVAKGKSSNN
ncbi:MAG: hypothetical protein JKY54_07900 [Flavobacteriales bacterium]|nr:hypothetical protein [Flavobacteriales bacterium]